MRKKSFIFFVLISFLGFSQNQLSFKDQAITEMQYENYAKAISMFTQVIQKDAKDFESYNYRAFSKLRSKNYASALTDANQSIKINPNCSSCFETRAEIKYRLNDLNGCVKDYEKAFELEPILANSENYYDVAKSKLETKSKNIASSFIPTASFIEKVLNSNQNSTDFYNQFYDNITGYSDQNYMTYNAKTNEHDIPQYKAEIGTTYKGTKVFFDLTSRTEDEPIYDIVLSSYCVCEWFSNWKSISALGFKEYKRSDSSGVLEIWGRKGNLEVKYSINTRSKEKSIMMWKK